MRRKGTAGREVPLRKCSNCKVCKKRESTTQGSRRGQLARKECLIPRILGRVAHGLERWWLVKGRF